MASRGESLLYRHDDAPTGPGRNVASTAYLQPRIGEPGDLRLRNESRFAVAVAGPLSLALSLRARHDSDPPDGVESLELAIDSGLRLSF